MPLFARDPDSSGSELTLIKPSQIGLQVREAVAQGLGCVLHIGPDPRGLGGIATVIKELVAVEPRKNHALVCASWSPRSRSRGLLSLPGCLTAVWRLRRASAADDAGVVHVHLSEGGSFFREGLILVWASLLGLPTVATLHGADFPTYAERRPWMVRLVLSQPEIIIALGPRTEGIVHRLVPDGQVAQTLNPVRLPRTEPPAQQGSDHGSYVLFAGEISKRKGVDRLLSAWSTVRATTPGHQLVLCGPHSDVQIDPRLSDVQVLGPRSHDETLRWIAGASLVCLPSRREVLPMVLLEAAVRGVPTVATDVGEIGVLRSSGGITLVPQEPGAIAGAITDLLRQPERLSRMGELSAAWACRHASSSAVRDSLDSVYADARRRRAKASQD